MKMPLHHRLLAPGLTAAISLFAGSLMSAEVYTGRVNLTGEMQNAAKPGSISFVFTGQVTGMTSGSLANVSGGGLFRSTTDNIVNTNFRGQYTTYTRLASTTNGPGRLIKTQRTTVVTTGRRTVRFPGGSITLDRPINGTRTQKQRISGRGIYRIKI